MSVSDGGKSHVLSLDGSISRGVARLRSLQNTDGSWAGAVDSGCYPSQLALFARRFVDPAPSDWDEVGAWVAEKQKADGSWGSAWAHHGAIGMELDAVVAQQVRRNTITSVLALKLVGGFHSSVERGEAWLRGHQSVTRDPLDDFLEAILGLRPWQRPKARDYLRVLSADFETTFPPWMVDLIAGATLAAAAHDERRGLSPLTWLTRRKMAALLLDRQLEDGSWFGTVDQTVYALLGLFLSGRTPTPEKLARAFESLGRRRDASRRIVRRNSIPVWDTVRSLLALARSGLDSRDPCVARALAYLRLAANEHGLWGSSPEVKSYPDCDDTSLAFLALTTFRLADRTHPSLRWLLKMQNSDGGWAAFMHNSRRTGQEELEDGSTPDVTAHVLQALSAAGYTRRDAAVRRALDYLQKAQEPDGSWYGRWGVCYIYGTASVLEALRSFVDGADHEPFLRKGIGWLESIQNADGGWGEHPSSYYRKGYLPSRSSFASQTASALEGLIQFEEAGRGDAVPKAMRYLQGAQLEDGSWPSFPTSAAMEVYENSIESTILPLSALTKVRNSQTIDPRTVVESQR